MKWGGKALQWLVKGLRLLTRGLSSGGGWIMKGINLVREIIVAGISAARKLGGIIKKVLAKVGELVDKVFDWFRRAFGKVGRKLKGKKGRPKKRRPDTGEAAQWKFFISAVQGLELRHQSSGVKRPPLERDYREIVRRFKSVARKQFVKADDGFWKLWVKKVGSWRPRKVGSVSMDHASRWAEAAKAVRHVCCGCATTSARKAGSTRSCSESS